MQTEMQTCNNQAVQYHFEHVPDPKGTNILVSLVTKNVFGVVLSDGLKRRFIRNPEPGTPTIFKGSKEEFDDKDFIPQFTKKGESWTLTNVVCRNQAFHADPFSKGLLSKKTKTFRSKQFTSDIFIIT